jgi:hypothetical protein
MLFRSIILLLVPLALAAPAPAPQSDVQCGRDDYTSDEIQAAADAACQYLQEGTTAGGSKYPEHYNDYEGFSFGGVSGPYYEFPIMANGNIYSGGKSSFPLSNKFYRCGVILRLESEDESVERENV